MRDAFATTGHMVVGNPLSSPDRASRVLSDPDDLHHPNLFRVGNRQRFPDITPTVLLDQATTDTDCLPSGGCPFEHQPCQGLTVDKAILAKEFFTSGERRFADGQLTFVHSGVGRSQVAERPSRIPGSDRSAPGRSVPWARRCRPCVW